MSADPELHSWKERHEALERDFAAVEEQLAILQNLYSASVQLLEARTPKQVVAVIGEVLENLICASAYAVLIWRPEEKVARVLTRRGQGDVQRLVGEAEQAAKSGEPVVIRARGGSFEVAVAPLRYEGQLVGALVIDGLLPQKASGLSETDLELLTMLGGQAAPALVRARERARAETHKEAVEKLIAPAKGAGQAAFQGNLDDTRLVEVLQLVGMVRKSGQLRLAQDAQSVELRFVDGFTVGARQDGQELPLQRAPQLVCDWMERSGVFSFTAEVPRGEMGPAISCDGLVLEALRLYDEQRSGGIRDAGEGTFLDEPEI